MKKIILSAIALLLVGGAFSANAQQKSKEELKAEAAAQKALKKELDANLKEAKKKSQVGEGYNPDFAAARAAIANAAMNPLSIGNADFYLLAGQVENNAFNAAVRENDLVSCAKAAEAGFEYFKQAYAAANGNKKVISEAQSGALNLYQTSTGMTLVAGVYYQEKDFQKSYEAFQVCKTAAQEPVLTSNPLAQIAIESNTADSTLNNVYLNSFSVAQYMLQDTTAAIKELLYLKEHAIDDVQLNQVLQALALDYYGVDDSIAFENVLKEGIEKLPTESWYMNNLINIYINRNDLASASKFLDKAIEKDPESVPLLNTKGNLLEQQGDVDAALKYYEKALANDPTNESVNSSLGRYYYNRALAVEDEYYNKKQFEAGDKAAAPYYEKSLPYYEAAYAFDSERKDKNVAIALRTLYGRTIAKTTDKALKAEITAKRAEVSAAYGFE